MNKEHQESITGTKKFIEMQSNKNNKRKNCILSKEAKCMTNMLHVISSPCSCKDLRGKIYKRFKVYILRSTEKYEPTDSY